MNNRLVSRVKALNFTVDHFPVFVDEHARRYFNKRMELVSSLMKRDIIRVASKCITRPKFQKKLDEMIETRKSFLFRIGE